MGVSLRGESPLQELAEAEKFLALEVRGTRYDIGVKFGLLQAQVALALNGADREILLSALVELLAEAGERRDAGVSE